MSSIQGRVTLLENTKELQKILEKRGKCYEFSPILKYIFSKDFSFIHLLENNLKSSQTFVQKPANQIFCVVMPVVMNLIRKLSSKQTENDVSERRPSSSILTTVKQNIAHKNEGLQKIEQSESQFEPGKNLLCTKDVVESDTNMWLIQFSSIFCITAVYLELFCIIYLIFDTDFKIGFIFLLLCSLCINYILLKISLINTSPKSRISREKNSPVAKRTLKDLKTLLSQILCSVNISCVKNTKML